jgi:hypothetical protein
MPITSVEIPNSISRIANNAFSRCEALESVTLPNTIKVLEATCFAWCSKLSEIELHEGLTDIMTYVFNSCPLKELVIPASVNNIYEQSFGNISKLQTVTFKKSLDDDGSIKMPNIQHKAFDNTSVATFKLPWSLNDHLNKFTGTYVDREKTYDKDIFFGATIGTTITFEDGKTITKENSVENGDRFKEAN